MARERRLDLGLRTRLMGVVNITPDSFSDGGRYLQPAAAARHALELASVGADILDFGGESSRPGAQPVSAAAEMDRVIPALEAVRGQTGALLSIDTVKAEVAEAALQAGAHIVNDISACRLDPRTAGVVSRWGAGVVLMHMRGRPETMQSLPPSEDIFRELVEELQLAVNTAYKSNIPRDSILLDPGIGFGKTAEDNLQILNRLPELEARFQLPILVGTSRKSFIGRLLGRPVNERLYGSLASAAAAVLRGAHVVRVHDVDETRQVVRVIDAIIQEKLID